MVIPEMAASGARDVPEGAPSRLASPESERGELVEGRMDDGGRTARAYLHSSFPGAYPHRRGLGSGRRDLLALQGERHHLLENRGRDLPAVVALLGVLDHCQNDQTGFVRGGKPDKCRTISTIALTFSVIAHRGTRLTGHPVAVDGGEVARALLAYRGLQHGGDLLRRTLTDHPGLLARLRRRERAVLAGRTGHDLRGDADSTVGDGLVDA